MKDFSAVIGEYFEEMHKPFANYIRSKYSALSDDDVEDLYMETFLAVHDNLNKGTVAPDTNWKGYILTIGNNLAMTMCKKNGILVHPDTKADEDGDDETSNRAWDKVPELKMLVEQFELDVNEKEKMIAVLNNLIKSLPEPCNVLIPDFYYNGLSLEDIKDEIGYSTVNAVKTQRYKCFQRLKTAALGMFAMMGLTIFKDEEE